MINIGLSLPFVEGENGRAVRRVARRLAAYLPTSLTQRILRQGLPAPGEARWLTAATLFSDISGFTHMTEELAADGPRGAEELNQTLLMTFTALINAIHDAGGTVSHFHGDAMMVYFPDSDGCAAERALACARFMQSLMLTTFTQVVTERSSDEKSVFDLTVKIGVGYGRCLEMVVGDPQTSLEFVLAGSAVDEAVAAQQRAQAGQVVASRSVLNRAGLPAAQPFRLLTEIAPVPSAPQTLHWAAFDQSALNHLVEVAPAFIPPALSERLQDRNTQFIAEHRPATSLFVRFEGVDYDAEDAGQLLQSYYQWACQIVARYGGENSRLNRVLTGDKGSQLHILFGAPVAPDAPEQAVRCALALQRERPPFIARQQIGVAAGRVFACAVGSHSRREYTAVGSVVNLSMRLTQVCPPGAVLTDKETADRIKELFVVEQLPALPLKGKGEPVPLYQVQGERRISTQLQARYTRWPDPPIGRVEELAVLEQRLDASLDGCGSMVALSGPIGSGRSRFLAAGVRHWLQAGGTGFVGVCQQRTGDVPFGPWQSVWRDFFGLTPDMDASAQAAAVVARAQALCPDCGSDVSLWGEALGLPLPQPAQLEQLSPEARQARLFSLIRRCLAAAATTQPLLIVLEDIHWADQSSLDLIDELAPHLEELPLSLILTYRASPNFTCRTFNRPVCTMIDLADLPPQRARQIVKEVVGVRQLPPLVEERLGLRDHEWRSKPVNPLFLEESLKMMLSLGILKVNRDEFGNGGRVHVDESLLARMQVPDTIYTLFLAQFDRLSAAGRSLLQVASVIGREFDLATLVAVAPGMSPQSATVLLAELMEMGLVQPVDAEAEPVYVFPHTLVHDVVYQNMPYARRQALHEAIADLLVSRHADNLKPVLPLLAYHYGQTDRHKEGLEYALAAAEDAAAIFANREAAELYGLASTHVEALGDAYWQTAVQIHIARARALRLLGQFTDAKLAATNALRLCLTHGDIDQTLPVYNLLAEIKYYQSDYAEAEILTDNIIHSLVERVPADELAQAYLLSGMAATGLLNLGPALDRLERAEEIYRARNDRQGLAATLTAEAIVYCHQQEQELAFTNAQRAVQLARKAAVPTQVGLTLHNLSWIQFRLGRPQAAMETVEEAIGLIRGTSYNLLARVLTHRAALSIYLGRFPDALADLTIAQESFEAMDDVPGLLRLYLLWGGAYYPALRQWDKARHFLEQAQELLLSHAEEGGWYLREQVRLWLGLSQSLLQVGDAEQAKVLLAKALTAVETEKLVWWRPLALYLAGLAELARGNNQQARPARRYFESALEAVQSGGCADELPLILWQLARAEPDDGRRGRYLKACVKAAQRRARYEDRIFCLHQAGTALARYDDARLRQIGINCLAQIDEMDAPRSFA